MIIFLYGVIPLLSIILWVFSRKVRLPEKVEETGISRELLKMSLFLYRKISGAGKLSFLSPETVRTNLKQLNNLRDFEGIQTLYYIRKIKGLIYFIGISCDVIYFLIWVCF